MTRVGTGVSERTTEVVPRPLLADAALDRELTDEGFVALPMLAPDEVAELRRLYDQMHPHPGAGFDTDFAYVSPEHKRAVDQGIRRVIEPRLSEVVTDVRLFNVTFVVKWPGGGSALPVHQDWAYVDEAVERSCTVWIPLDDTSEELGNGPLGLIPRSHLLPAGRRGASSLPWYLPHRDQLGDHLELQRVDAGGALVFDTRILHGSPSSASAVPRRAIAAMITPAGTPLRYHHLEDGEWWIYEVDEDFFVECGPIDLRSRRPEHARLIAREPAAAPSAPISELELLCGIQLDERLGLPSRGQFPMAGEPLGESLPLSDGRSTAPIVRWLHRSSEALWDGPTRPTPELDPTLQRSDWWHSAPSSGPWSEMDARTGQWSARRLRLEGTDAPHPAQRLATELGADAAWLLRAGAQSALVPRRSGHNGSSLVFIALELQQCEGSLVLQVGRTMHPLLEWSPVAIDPTWEHAAWNLGATEVPILCLSVPLPATRVQRAVRSALSTIGALRPPAPVVT